MFTALTVDITTEQTQEVEYFGVTIVVPKQPGVVTTDSDGTVYWNPKGFTPRAFDATWTFVHTGYKKIARISYCGDWKQSMMEIR